MTLGREGKGLFCVYADGKHIIAYEPTQKETFCSISVYKLADVTEIAADMAESLRERCNALGLD